MNATDHHEPSLEDATLALLKDLVSGSEFAGEVFIAGGYVRDEILGGTPKDIDLVVNAAHVPCDECAGKPPAPETSQGKPCAGCMGSGTKGPGIRFAEFVAKRLGIYKARSNPVTYPRFGTAMIHLQGVTYAGVDLSEMQVECVGPRTEVYADRASRKPEVTAGSLKQDVERRDFTANSLLKNLTSGEVVDLTGHGLEDLRAGLLRTPLDPDVTFDDDPLRMLRAVRFAVKYGWRLAPGLADAIKKSASRLAIISRERVRDELEKMLTSADPRRAVTLLVDTDLIDHVHPKLASALRAMVGMEQNRYHTHDVFTHVLEVLANAAPRVTERLAALLHDIAKPQTRTAHPAKPGEYQFLEHEKEGEVLAREILTDLRFPGKVVDRVCSAVRLHMGMKKPEAATDRAIRRWVRKAGEHLDAAIDLLRADALGHGAERGGDPGSTDLLRRRIAGLGADQPESLRQQVVTGHDVMKTFGLEPGPQIGLILQYVQDGVDESPEIDRETLLAKVAARFGLIEE